jgi:hypothetical protein
MELGTSATAVGGLAAVTVVDACCIDEQKYEHKKCDRHDLP